MHPMPTRSRSRRETAPPDATEPMAPCPTEYQRSDRSGEAAVRGGFTFIEMIVGLAIMVIVAATITPALLGVVDKERRDAALTSLTGISDAVAAFRADVNEYPGLLTQLTTPIGSEPDLCGANYSGGEQGDWEGPYLNRVVPPTGLPIGIGRARNQLTRFPNTNNPSHMILTVDSVVIEDALALNRRLDADGDDGTANAVRWTMLSAADGLVTLGFWGPIQDLC